MNADTIQISGITAIGYHGVLAQERENGQRFVVDVELGVDVRKAAQSDDLTDTVDYAAVTADVLAAITGEPCNLIETLASQIATRALENPSVQSVAVTIHKPDAPIEADFDDVSLRVLRSR